MKVVFNGLLEKKQNSGGCNCKRQGSTYSFVNSRKYILPSGTTKTFFVGRPEEVSERDAKFLLSYRVTDANGTRGVFSKVGE